MCTWHLCFSKSTPNQLRMWMKTLLSGFCSQSCFTFRKQSSSSFSSCSTTPETPQVTLGVYNDIVVVVGVVMFFSPELSLMIFFSSFTLHVLVGFKWDWFKIEWDRSHLLPSRPPINRPHVTSSPKTKFESAPFTRDATPRAQFGQMAARKLLLEG